MGASTGKTAEYPGGTRRSSLPPDMSMRDDVRPRIGIQGHDIEEVGRPDKRERETKMATEDVERGIGRTTQQKPDDLKGRKGDPRKRATGPDR
ncbi:hypothetical protein NDU88_004435 [Pleurodeles waltl]|uniref:Uncharacterized protein n=1 Tax=Pleurodeles waltl TaxID=8319 RepID=A0AAV7MBQ0_PLEWA|nr:hypothetical protein NDU88_004435 [Pleurodeles waltl]